MSIPPGRAHLPQVPGMACSPAQFCRVSAGLLELEETFHAMSWFTQMLSDVRFHLLSAGRVFPVTRQLCLPAPCSAESRCGA